MRTLVSTFFHEKRWQEAKELQLQLMAAKKKLLGSVHPETLNDMVDLAGLFRSVKAMLDRSCSAVADDDDWDSSDSQDSADVVRVDDWLACSDKGPQSISPL